MRNLLFFLFFVSGFSGLIYESIWTHYLKLFLGHAAYAQTLVLAIFMGGMAIGAWLCSRMSTGFKNLLVWYALVEGVVGLAALLYHPVFTTLVDASFSGVIPFIDNPVLIQAYKWSLGTVMILPQSVLLGMTFPLMSGGLIRLFPERRGGSIAMLYFTNSLGGAIGVLVSGFVTVRWLGLNGTIVLAGCINLVLAAIVLWLFRHRAGSPIESSSGIGVDVSRRNITLLVVAGITGAASFVYEIGWIRMLNLVLGSSTHAFELVLSAFILGLAFGGLWIRGRIDNFKNPVIVLAWVQVLMGVLAMTTLAFYGQAFRAVSWLFEVLPDSDARYLWFNVGSHALAMAIMLPATFCAGMTLPLITHVLLRQGYGEKAIGAVYSTNTLGAIAGILAAVHVGLPYLGLKGLIVAGAALDVGVGLFLLYKRIPFGIWAFRIAGAAITAALFAAVLVGVDLDAHKMASGVYRTGDILGKDHRVLFHRDGKTSTVSITANENNVFSLRTNGKSDASIHMDPGPHRQMDEVTMTMTGAIPLLFKPDSEYVANIGFGSGMTGHVVLASPMVRRLDNIEIEPFMVEAAKKMRPYNNRIFDDPRSNIYFEDAKTFFSSNKQRYDIIISEPSNPWVSGVASLFSEEFYAYIKQYLLPGGIVAQWLQLYEFDLKLLSSVLKAVDNQFDHYSVFAIDEGNLLIVASPNLELKLENLSQLVPSGLVPELQRIGVTNATDIRARFIGNQNLMEHFLALFDTPSNSDYFPYVDQHAAQARIQNRSATDIFFPVQYPLPLLKLLHGWELSSATTSVSGSHLASITFPALVATYARDRILGNTPFPLNSNINQQSRRALVSELEEVDALVRQCERLPGHGDRIFVLYGLMNRVLPYLNSGEIKEVLDRLSVMECGKITSETEFHWTEFFRAIGHRDYGKMSQHSKWLLSRPDYLTEARARYLVAVGLIARLALQNPDDALSFWNTWRISWFPEPFNELALPVRYLVHRLMNADGG